MAGLQVEAGAPIEGFAEVVFVVAALVDPLREHPAQFHQLFRRHGIFDQQYAIPPELILLILCKCLHGLSLQMEPSGIYQEIFGIYQKSC